MRKELYDMRIRALALFFLMLALFFAIAPFQDYAVGTLRSLEGSSGEFMGKYIDREYVEQLTNWSFYMYSQWFGKNFGQLVPIIAIVLAFPLFSRESENGTLEFLLVRQSRLRVFMNKSFTGLLALVSIIVILSFLPILYSFVTGKEFVNEYVPQFMIFALVGGLLWYSVTLIFSVVFNDQVKPILASLGALVLTTVLGLLRPLRYLNTYRYILGVDIFSGGDMDILYTVSLLLVSGFLLFISYEIFNHKEI
ncbi:ABC transporter permease [Kosmotoga pacifica]|uniref:ABC transporter permease n=1 Tax=Kosmotoga pacifica TaxID=1330330 RepID=A0A0G2Z5Q6_9BACT|nr:ABC transporter permease subunit [Kosmotoga pacifica]AKI96897.1 ABC transporter permease [Kosmotoga pacifica]